MRRCTATPGNCVNPCKSSKVSVNPLKPPAVKNVRSPASILAASRNELASTARAERGDVCSWLVILDQPVDLAVRDVLNSVDQIAHAITVDGVTELDVRGHLVRPRSRPPRAYCRRSGRICALPIVPRAAARVQAPMCPARRPRAKTNHDLPIEPHAAHDNRVRGRHGRPD